MNRSFLFLIIFFLAAGCKTSNKKNTQTEKQEVAIFPITSFIEGQLHLVDSFQLPVQKYITVNSKTDTALISIPDFKQLAQEFLHPDINDPQVSKAYKENSFADQSIKGVTFTYTTEDKDMEIQRVDVVVSASPVANDKVRSIYIEKQYASGDTAINKKLYWRADRNFQIITIRQLGEQPPLTSVMKVEWDRD